MKITKRTLVPLRQSKSLIRQRPDRAWAVFLPSDGAQRWARKYFRQKSDAEAFCDSKRSELAALGIQAQGLTDSVKREALACLQILNPIGKTLIEAVTWYSEHYRSLEKSVTVSQATEALMKRAKADGLSLRHIRSISSVMSIFGRDFSQRQVVEVSGDDIQSWLDRYRTKNGQPLCAVSHNSYRRYIGLFFSFCLKRGWVAANPLSRVGARRVVAKVPRLLSPDELRTILNAAPEALRPVLAIQALCGLRVAEAARLRWSDVLWTENGNFIRIGADTAKTSRRRLAPIPDGLAGYLRDVSKGEGHVYLSGKGSVDALQKVTVAFRQSLSGVAWGRNALRASALSYRLALTKDAAGTALEMGNSPTVLMRDYRELTTKATAERWFSSIPN
jgi:integrase